LGISEYRSVSTSSRELVKKWRRQDSREAGEVG
jgi:hypothetical protein